MKKKSIIKIVIDDESLIEMLNKQKKTTIHLELEVTFLPAPIQENKNEAPYLPKMIMLADKKRGIPVGQNLCQSAEQVEQTVIELLAEYIKKYGRPAYICVRDDSVGHFVEDLCQKIDVTLIEDGKTSVIDTLLTDMFNFIGL